MNLIATGTVIRGKGQCQAFVDGVAQMDIQHQQERWMQEVTAEMERLRTAEKGRNRMAAELAALKRRALNEVPGMMGRMKEAVVDAWCMAFGTVISWGEMLGLWVYEYAD